MLPAWLLDWRPVRRPDLPLGHDEAMAMSNEPRWPPAMWRRPEMPEYPHSDGNTTVLGPQIFASLDGEVICWRGENYVKQERRVVTSDEGTSYYASDDLQTRRVEAVEEVLLDEERGSFGEHPDRRRIAEIALAAADAVERLKLTYTYEALCECEGEHRWYEGRDGYEHCEQCDGLRSKVEHRGDAGSPPPEPDPRDVKIARLRAALTEIASGHPDGGPWSGEAEKIARRALAAREETR